ncbi:MAG: exodeoxyribonuclease V subunit gamma [Sinobacterium sp.]|nr:exodeoxyribonuclease V subunit gamma [Sinobacterium sp.]
MLKIFYSNKIEVLSAQLIECIVNEPLSPLASENILLESPAMSHWLTKQIATHAGIAANIEYPFPAALVWRVYRRLMPDLPERSSFDRLSLSLRIYALFTALSADDSTSADISALRESMGAHDFSQFKSSPLGEYCRTLDNANDLFVLANHVAGLYDQYQIYRPDWLQAWFLEKNISFSPSIEALSQWQKELWQWLTQLNTHQSDPDRAKIFAQAMNVLDDMIAEDPHANSCLFEDLPRLHCFALSNLPSSYLMIIEKLAHWVDVMIYGLNPSVHFWQDAMSHRQQIEQSFSEQSRQDNESAVFAPLNVASSLGNELLVQLAHQQKAYLNQLLLLKTDESHECFIELDSTTLLGKCQNSITKLEQYPDKHALPQLDDSIEIHSCHNRLREVEVVQQKILQVLDDNPAWRQGDIAIIVPDVDSYAPYFHAVFGSANSTANPHALLHYAVSEKNASQQSSLSSALEKLLSLMQSEFTHSEVLSFLSEPCVHQYFGFESEQMAVVEQVLQQCNVRFGLDANQPLESHEKGASLIVDVSFTQAKARLLQSFYQAESVNGIDDMLSPLLPHIEHERANIVGQLCEFIDQLKYCLQRFQRIMLSGTGADDKQLAGSATVSTWLDTFLQCAKATVIFDGDFEEQASQALSGLQKLQEQANLSSFSLATEALFIPQIDFSIFSGLVTDVLGSSAQNFYYSETAINVASFLPMQSVPFKMIAVLGINDGEFPVIAPTDQLDLMVHQTRQGDRNKIDEQRSQFLQAFLSAREKFFVSYLGRNQYDNTEQFPSLLLKELIQFLDNNFSYTDVNAEANAQKSGDDSAELSSFIVRQHALQAFSSKYFTDANSSIFNSSDEYKYIQARALAKANDGKVLAPSVFSNVHKTTTASVGDHHVQLALGAFIKGLNNPSSALLNGLGIFLRDDELENTDTELFTSSALTEHQLRGFRFSQNLQESTMNEDLSAFIRKGLLPQSQIGRQALLAIDAEVKQLQCLLQEQYLGDFPDTQNFELQVSLKAKAVTLSCDISQMNLAKGQVLALSCNKLRGRHVLKSYIMHLCASLHYFQLQQYEEPSTRLSSSLSTYILSSDSVYKFPPISVEFAQQELERYLQFFYQVTTNPSLFFVGSSFDYFSKLAKGEDKAAEQLKISLWGTDRSRGEIMDEYHQYVFRGRELPLDTLIEEATNMMSSPYEQLMNMTEAEA